MGRKKQWLPLDGRPLLLQTAEVLYAVCEEVVVVANDPDDVQRLHELGLRTVSDNFPGQGPLAGLEAGLRAFVGLRPEEAVCLVGCDLPFLRAEVLQDLAAELAEDPLLQASVPVSTTGEDAGRWHPVCAVYRAEVAEIATALLQRGENAMRHFLARLRMQEVPVERWEQFVPLPFINMNTPADYERVCTLWKKEGLESS
jgi:molybdenum cofactor guanylyltransferase